MTNTVSRRDFLRRSALATGAAGLLAASLRPARSRPVGANERINIGIIGVGGRGRALMNMLMDLAKKPSVNIAVVAVCDVYERRLRDAASRSGAKPYRDYHDLLNHPDLDAVVIATPDHWHARMTIDAMKAGKDVYCEKPMTRYWEEAKEVARVARETGRVTQIGAQSASDERYWKAHEIIASGGIGKLVWSQSGSYRNVPSGDWNWPIDRNAGPNKKGLDHIDWQRWLGPAPKRPWEPERFFRFRKFWDYSGGQATDLLYHSLSHMEIALGPEFPKRVVASGGNYVFTLQNDNREVPDTFHVLIDYPSKHTVVLTATQVNKTRAPEMIRGRKGNISFEKWAVIVTPEEPFKDEVNKQRIQCRPRRDTDHMVNFLECMRTRKECTLNAQVGYKVMVAIGLSTLAYRHNKVLLFDPEREEVIS